MKSFESKICYTKQGLREAPVGEVFINQNAFISFQTATSKLDKVAMLNTGNEHHFI